MGKMFFETDFQKVGVTLYVTLSQNITNSGCKMRGIEWLLEKVGLGKILAQNLRNVCDRS